MVVVVMSWGWSEVRGDGDGEVAMVVGSGGWRRWWWVEGMEAEVRGGGVGGSGQG